VIFAVHAMLASSFQAAGSALRLATLALLVTIGLAAYLASLAALGVTSLRDLVAIVRAPSAAAASEDNPRAGTRNP
jgi:hypothetical protein